MPRLRFCKERLHPDPSLAHRLLVGLGGVVAAHALEIVGGERAMHDPSMLALGASGFVRAGIAGHGRGAVDDHCLAVLGGFPLQRMVLRTGVFIALSIVDEVRLGEERWSS